MKKKNSLVVLGMLVLLSFGYAIPVIVMAVEDRHLQSESKRVSIEKIELNSQSIDVVQKLNMFSKILQNNIVVKVDKENSLQFVEDKQESAEKDDLYNGKYQSILSSIEEFWKLNAKEEVAFEKCTLVYYEMMVSSEDEREYCFWIDDATGKLIAFDIPFGALAESDEGFYAAIENVGKYYGFQTFGLSEYIKNIQKLKYWESSLMLFDETGECKLDLCIFKSGERLYFNMYPGSVSISDGIKK